MTRRHFGKILAAPSLSPVYEPPPGAGAPFRSEPGDWPTRVYRRFSVDMHVPDWSPELLSRFDASEFVSLIARGGAKSMMMMANSHTGLCLWRTSLGRTHANLRGRDFFGEVVSECRKRNIHPIAYFSVIYDNASFTAHPDWRIERADGLEPYSTAVTASAARTHPIAITSCPAHVNLPRTTTSTVCSRI